jgi:hypothetical protein
MNAVLKIKNLFYHLIYLGDVLHASDIKKNNNNQ